MPHTTPLGRRPRLDPADRQALATLGVGLLLACVAVLVLLAAALTLGFAWHLLMWAAG